MFQKKKKKLTKPDAVLVGIHTSCSPWPAADFSDALGSAYI